MNNNNYYEICSLALIIIVHNEEFSGWHDDDGGACIIKREKQAAKGEHINDINWNNNQFFFSFYLALFFLFLCAMGNENQSAMTEENSIHIKMQHREDATQQWKT